MHSLSQLTLLFELLQATALDKASRYFEGRKQHLTLPDGKKSDAEEDEIF